MKNRKRLGKKNKNISIILYLLCVFFLFSFSNPKKVEFLYRSFDHNSLDKLCAFYTLYNSSEYAFKVKEKLSLIGPFEEENSLPLLASVFSKIRLGELSFSSEELVFFNKISSCLMNRDLKGFYVRSLPRLLELKDKEIDLGTALILTELFDKEEEEVAIALNIYNTCLDIIALKVLFSLPEDEKSPEIILDKINEVLFEEMLLRFPSQGSMTSAEYTMITSVLKSRFGVCLGVVTVYLSVAQRLGLPLDIVTIPGHIYLAYNTDCSSEINIETTAFGVHFNTNVYLDTIIEQPKKRTLKEVIGLVEMNKGGDLLHSGCYEEAIKAYEEASNYVEDFILKELKFFLYLCLNKKKEANGILKILKKQKKTSLLLEDFLKNRTTLEGIKQVLSLPKEDDYQSLLVYKKNLEETVKKYPHFREGLKRLASVNLVLGKHLEALECLEKFFEQDQTDIFVLRDMIILYLKRLSYEKAQNCLDHAERIIEKENIRMLSCFKSFKMILNDFYPKE